MKRSYGMALRFSALVAMAAVLGVLLSLTPAPAASPYVSALAGIAAVDAQAAPSACGNSGCNRFGHCSKSRGTNCQYSGGECYQSPC